MTSARPRKPKAGKYVKSGHGFRNWSEATRKRWNESPLLENFLVALLQRGCWVPRKEEDSQ